MTGIERAILAAGSAKALALACGVQEPAVSKWKARGYAPWDHHARIHVRTGVELDVLEQDVISARRKVA